MPKGPIPVPRDCVGNEIVKDMLIHCQTPYPIVFKVVSVETGGIQTPQGPTPARIRLITEIVITQVPGLPFIGLIKVVLPSHEKAIESLADMLSQT